MVTLGKREQEVWEYVSDCLHYFPVRSPSFREITRALDYSSNTTAVRAVQRLIAIGYLKQSGKKTGKRIKLGPNAPERNISLPWRGVVSAGTMSEAIEQDERVDITAMFTGDKFLLRAQGDSMINAMIDDGDWLVVDRAREPKQGDIVIAQTDDGEATVKYFYREKNRIRLQPANPDYKTIYRKNVEIVGVVHSVHRQLA